MNFKYIILIALFVVFVSCQTRVQLVTLDDFTVDQASLIVLTGTTPNNEAESTITTTNTASLLGGTRSLAIAANAGSPSNAVLSTSVSSGSWASATPSTAEGFARYQLDGSGDFALDTTGLGGLDFTSDDGDSFILTVSTDFETTYSILVYTFGAGYNSFCQGDVVVEPNPSGVNLQQTEIFFTEFTSGCDFTNVGAIEIEVQLFRNVDTNVFEFVTFGDVPVVPSNSPTPSPGVSPSQSQTPFPSEIPSPLVCDCECPAFTCELNFDFDDDNNTVYYFDDDDDTDPGEIPNDSLILVSDDDSGDDDDNSATYITLSFTIIAVIIVALLF